MTTSSFELERLCDELGPLRITHLHDAVTGLRAVVVVDNVACGPSVGGVRMAPDVTTEEVSRLARAMTLKNAGAGLPHGGGKAGILADPTTPGKERLIRSFARAIRDMTDFVPGPDMGTDETCMAWILDEIGRSVGLPRVVGGIPLDELGATGFGLAVCAEIAADFAKLDLSRATLAIEGFGNVGRPAARFLADRGVTLVAASDSKGAIHDPDGIDVDALVAAKRDTGSVTGYGRGRRIGQHELFALPFDILIPAARPDCIHEENVEGIRAKLVLQGANIPATPAAEARLHEKGVVVVPDFIANAGGVICAVVELHGGSEASVFPQIEDKIGRNTREVLERTCTEGVRPRRAAEEMARARVEGAMALRGHP